MSKTLTLTPKGLYTYYNNLASVPEGALLSANNTVINREGVAEPRRGIKWYSSETTDPAKQLMQYKARILRHVGSTIAYDNLAGVFTNFSGSFNQPNDYTRIKSIETKGNLYFTSDIGVQKISAKSAADFSTASITEAGGVISVGGQAICLFTTGGFLLAGNHTSYKVTWAYKDANGLLIEGVPSNAIEIENPTASDANVQLKIYIPQDVTSVDYTFRVFRCEQKTIGTALSEEYNLVFEGNPTAPELITGYLFYTDSLAEDFRTSGVPLYTNPISGSGINQANYKPPFATDIELFNNYVFYANTRLRHFKTLSLQDVSDFTSGTSDFIISDGVTTNTYTFAGESEVSTVKFEAFSFIIDGSYFFLNAANNERRYFVWFDKTGTTPVPNTAETAGRIGIKVTLVSGDNTGALVAAKAQTAIEAITDDFLIAPTGAFLGFTNAENGYADATADSVLVPSQLTFATVTQGIGEDAVTKTVLLSDNIDPSIAIRKTAESLCRIINQNLTEIVTAQYVSGLNDTPGNIVLIRKDLVDLAFYTSTTDSAIITDFYPNLSATKYASDSSTSVNALYFSKLDEPESVPLVNVVLIGSSDAPILRIKALRESLFIFKTDGLYRLTGFTSSDFTVSLFDNTILLKVPDSVATLNNEIYYYGTQGVAKVSEVGKDVISKPIQDKLLPYISTAPNLAKVGFGVAYETDRSYMLWTVSNKADTVATVCYRFNIETGAWTEWKISKTCAVLNNNTDMLYFGSGSANVIEVERKNFDRFDYADREIGITLPTLSTFGDIIKPSGASNIEVGDVIIQTQYLTISRFNQILKMLDTDAEISNPSSLFYPTFSPSAGENLSSRVTAFVAELNSRDTSTFTDTNGNTAYVFSGTNDPATIQVEWNKIVDRLNESPNVFLSNYPQYTNSTSIEAIVLAKNISNNEITVNNALPWLEGNMMLYKAIKTEIQYVPQHGGDPIDFKQFSTAQAVFEYRSFYSAQLGFNSDLSTDFETIDFSLNSAATFGNFVFGTGAVWGGLGDKAPLRTYIPRNKQRSRFIGAKFTHVGALESYGLYGIAISFNSYSDRAYK
jgi:hypothetical protein